MKRAILVGVACLFATASQLKGASILVGQCINLTACVSSGAPWSDSLTLADLTSLGLGLTVPLIAAQTSEVTIRLGVTTLTFTTSGSPVIETSAEFSGGVHNDPCDLCEIDTVGMFAIPSNALSAIISGHFGNSANPTSAGVNVCLGSGAGPCSAAAVPEPGTFKPLGATLVVAGSLRLRRRMRRESQPAQSSARLNSASLLRAIAEKSRRMLHDGEESSCDGWQQHSGIGANTTLFSVVNSVLL